MYLSISDIHFISNVMDNLSISITTTPYPIRIAVYRFEIHFKVTLYNYTLLMN